MSTLIRAELLKLRSIRTFWWTLVATLAFVPAGIALAILGAGHHGAASVNSTEGVRTAIGAGSSGGVLMIIIGIVMIAGEFRHNTITSTFLITPERSRIVGAKFAASVVVGIGVSIAASLVTLAIALPWLSSKGVDLGPHVGDIATVLLGGLGATTLGGLVGVGLGAIITNQTVAVTIALVWMFVVESMLAKFASGVARWMPGGASSAMSGIASPAGHLLPVWAAALVLTGYGVAFAGAGARLIVRQDIS